MDFHTANLITIIIAFVSFRFLFPYKTLIKKVHKETKEKRKNNDNDYKSDDIFKEIFNTLSSTDRLLIIFDCLIVFISIIFIMLLSFTEFKITKIWTITVIYFVIYLIEFLVFSYFYFIKIRDKNNELKGSVKAAANIEKSKAQN